MWAVTSDAVFHRDLNAEYPIVDYGRGIYLHTLDGRTFLDASSGAVAANLGHGVPEIADAIQTQARRVGFAHTLRFETEALHEAATRICSVAPSHLERVFFASGGSEANESAFKLARQWHLSRGDADRHLVIGMWGNYHGNTLASLAVGGDADRRRHYSPMLPRTLRLPSWREIDPHRMPDALESLIVREGRQNIAALILETFVGSQLGAYEPPHEVLRALAEICRRHGVLLITDEVMTGFGRCGSHFAFERAGLEPDLVTFGKGVTGGYAPLSGVIVSASIVKQIREGGGIFNHGYTYSGHPVAAAAASAALALYAEKRLWENALEQGRRLKEGLAGLARQESGLIADVRGAGLLLALEFERAVLSPGGATDVNRVAMQHGLVLYPGSSLMTSSGDESGERGLLRRHHVLIAPPLNIDDSGVSDLLRRLEATLADVAAGVTI